MSAWDLNSPLDTSGAGGEERFETIELVGPHLRVSGTISLARFHRLSDRVNNSRGYIRLTDATLLRRNGEPTNLVVPELLVNQDEITFIGQTATEVTAGEGRSPEGGSSDRPSLARVPRRFVIFTPGHTLTGTIHLYGETELAQFVDSTDPRFVPMSDVRARSLADRRVISHFSVVLVNRTQMTAASLLERAGKLDEVGAQAD
jgi:hypothetical protein